MLQKSLLAVALLFTAIGAGLSAGANYALDMVHDQLIVQKITFPDAATLEKDNPALVPYANAQVDTGAEAKAFSEYIGGHLKKVAGGKTYSEVSSEYLKNTSDQKLAGQRQTLFMGETLRGLLLSAYGWGLVGQIALYVAYGLWVVAAASLGLLVYLVAYKKSTPARKSSAKTKRRA